MGLLFAIFFFIWPFGTVFFTLKNYSKTWTKNIIWLFVIFYGYAFVLSNDTMDANRILSKFEFIVFGNFGWDEVINIFFFQNEDGVDIIQPIVFYFTSKFTHDFQALMAVLAVILGFFYSRNIDYLLSKREGRIKSYNWLVLWMFCLVIGFWEINMFRFWTSALMFFFCVIPFLYEGKRERLFLLPLTALLHFSFLFPLIVFVIYCFLRNKTQFYFILYLFSFALVSINVGAIGEILLDILPSSFHRKVGAYASNEMAEEVASNVRSISSYMRYLMFFCINSLFVYFYFFEMKSITAVKGQFNLFNFSLLFMAGANFISIIPSGYRFLYLSALISFSFVFFFLQKNKIKNKGRLILNISIPFFILASIGFIRLAIVTINPMVLLGNPILLLLFNPEKAIIQYLL